MNDQITFLVRGSAENPKAAAEKLCRFVNDEHERDFFELGVERREPPKRRWWESGDGATIGYQFTTDRPSVAVGYTERGITARLTVPDYRKTVQAGAMSMPCRSMATRSAPRAIPYFSHPLEVAAILTDMHLDEATIAVALLHDTIEDTTATRAGDRRAVRPGHRQAGRGPDQAEEARSRLEEGRAGGEPAQAAAGDLRGRARPAGQARRPAAQHAHARPCAGGQAAAHRRGDDGDLCAARRPHGHAGHARGAGGTRASATSIRKPTATVTERLADIFERNQGVVGEIETIAVERCSRSMASRPTVKSRQKKPWSVFRKMEAKALSFEQLSDIFGFRVVVDTVDGLLPRARRDPHDLVDGARAASRTTSRRRSRTTTARSTPPSSARRASASSCRSAPREMNKIAEYGVAAHALYKDGGGKPNGAAHAISKETNAYAWLRRTIEQLAEGDNPEDFLENTKLELFQDQVFCFTPKGMLIALPRGATPIDFAYAVHTDVGDTCVGAKVNGRIMPLMTELKNGDEVEIIRSKAQVPPAAWESIVVTGKARAAIRRATKNAIRKQYSGLGMRILERAFERAGKTFAKDSLKPVLHRLARKDVEDVLAAVGRGELPSTDVLRAVYPDYQGRARHAAAAEAARGGLVRTCATPPACCSRCPGRAARKDEGDRRPRTARVPIRGVARRPAGAFRAGGRGARRPHRRHHAAGLRHHHLSDPVAVADRPSTTSRSAGSTCAGTSTRANKERFPARISVTAINAPGSLAEIAQVIAVNDANIHTLSMIRTAPDFTEMLIDLEVWDLKHLNRLLSQLKENSSVSDARRVNG